MRAKTVLVVDDDRDARRFLSVLLEDGGYEAVAANGAEEALARVSERLPDLITLDVAMPNRSGLWVYKALREQETLKHIPVVIVTGATADIEHYLSSRPGVPAPAGCVDKPVKPDLLLQTIERALARRQC